MRDISGNMEPVSSLNGILYSVDAEYAFSVIDNYPMGAKDAYGVISLLRRAEDRNIS